MGKERESVPERAERKAARSAFLSMSEEEQSLLNTGMLYMIDMGLREALPETLDELFAVIETHLPGYLAALTELDRRTDEFLVKKS